jgi:AcrR family transcriptional regulator
MWVTSRKSSASSRADKVPDGRRVRWQAHRDARRDDLIVATIAAVRRHGAGVGMEQIAAQAGTSKAVVYRYFTDKADLYLAVGSRIAGMLTDTITRAMEDQAQPRAVLQAGVEAYLTLIEAEPELYRFVVRRPLLQRTGGTSSTGGTGTTVALEQDPVADYMNLLGARISRILGDVLREMGVDSGAAEPWGYGMVGMVHSAGDWWLERQSMSRSALAEYLTSLIWGGLAGAYAAAGVDAPADTTSLDTELLRTPRTASRAVPPSSSG